MNINVFVHTVADVDFFAKSIKEQNTSYKIYVTHCGVYEYIKTVYEDWDVLFLSSLVTQEHIEKLYSLAQKQSVEIVQSLDDQYSSFLSKQIEVPRLEFFNSLYSYHLPNVLSGFLLFKEVVLSLNNKGTIDENKIICFEYKENLFNSFSLKEFIDEEGLDIIWYSIPSYQEQSSVWKQFRKLIVNKQKIFQRVVDYCYECLAYYDKSKPTILYMDMLYDLNFLKRSRKFRLIPYAYQAIKHKFSRNISTSLDNDKIEKIKNYFQEKKKDHLTNVIKQDFLLNIENYALGLLNLDKLLKKENDCIAVWGNPPVEGFKALFYEYLHKKNVKVVGMQHGASYVDQHYGYHYDSDFKRCDIYISYGFTQEDIKQNFLNEREINCNVFPLGSGKKFVHESTTYKHNIDILFPVTNTISIFDGGFARVKPDILHNDQMDILHFLEKKSEGKSLKTVIKPFKQTSLEQTSVYLELKRLQNIEVEWNMNFEQAIGTFNPKCVIIEFFSTPLYEILDLDVEIFLFVRDADHLTDKARIMLDKRVHIVNSYKEFEYIFNLWLENKLPSKRDNSYMQYYVYKPNMEDNIIRLFNDL